MLEIVIDNIFVKFNRRVFQQTICIQMDANRAPPFVDLFLQAYEAEFFQGPLKNKDIKLSQTFNSIFRYIYTKKTVNHHHVFLK